MSKELESLYTLCGQIVTDMGSDEYYKCREARDIIEKHLNAIEVLKNKIKTMRDNYKDGLAGYKGCGGEYIDYTYEATIDTCDTILNLMKELGL